MLALVGKGRARQAAYVMVQRSAMRTFHGEGRFRDLLASDPEVSELLSPEDIDRAFDLDHALAHVPGIIERAIAGALS